MITERFEVPSRLKSTGIGLLLIGLLALLLGVFSLAMKGNEHDVTRFWIVLLQNSVFFLFISAASIFIQAATSLAQAGWIVAYRRVPESIGANVWVFGLIALVVLFCIVFGFHGHNPIFHWVTPVNHETGKVDEILTGKSSFLNKGMFVGFSIVTVGLWSFFGIKFRQMSIAQETAPKNSTKLYWKIVAMGGAFLFVYALSMMSTTPWYWIMSIDAHWYSTLFSWYVFASSFVSGMSLILLWTIYLKNQNKLEFVTKEHIHDLGKFMFAFSIFWTYLWFAQFMLIWYANIPEETTYFKIRMQGPYCFFFWANLILNFCIPILILMSRPSKRNYFTIVFMAIAIIFGHWLDFYLMTMPGPLGANWHMSWYELGIPCGFIGIMILVVSRTLSKANLVPLNHPFLKETLIHIS